MPYPVTLPYTYTRVQQPLRTRGREGEARARAEEDGGPELADVIDQLARVALEVAYPRADRQEHLLRRPAPTAPHPLRACGGSRRPFSCRLCFCASRFQGALAPCMGTPGHFWRPAACTEDRPAAARHATHFEREAPAALCGWAQSQLLHHVAGLFLNTLRQGTMRGRPEHQVPPHGLAGSLERRRACRKCGRAGGKTA